MLESTNGKSNGKVQINGHEYLTVAYRLASFRAKYPIESGWSLESEPIRCDDEKVLVKAIIKSPDGKVVATGHAEEKRNGSFINRTSALENAETSAIGRALASAGFIGSEFASADELALAVQAQAGQASKAEAKAQPKETEAQPNSPSNQAAMPAQPKPALVVSTKPEAQPQSQAAEPSQVKQAAELNSQTAKQAKPSEGQQSQPKQNGQANQVKLNQASLQPTEEIAERWAREHLAEWLDAPCPFGKAERRTWRQLAENQGEKIALKGKPCLPRAYLHAIESWASCGVWQRMKAKVALEVGKNGNGKAATHLTAIAG